MSTKNRGRDLYSFRICLPVTLLTMAGLPCLDIVSYDVGMAVGKCSPIGVSVGVNGSTLRERYVGIGGKLELWISSGILLGRCGISLVEWLPGHGQSTGLSAAALQLPAVRHPMGSHCSAEAGLTPLGWPLVYRVGTGSAAVCADDCTVDACCLLVVAGAAVVEASN